jgi:DNA-binding transcriptional MerR regulator
VVVKEGVVAERARGTSFEAGGEEGFGGPQVCSIVGITYRQLDYWARTGLLRPSIADAAGSGSRRRYSYRDLVQLKVIKQLLDAGVSLQSARRAVQCLREHLGADLASASLVLAGSTSVLARSGEEVVDLLAGGQGVLNVVPLGGVVEQLDAAILELGARAAARETSTGAAEPSVEAPAEGARAGVSPGPSAAGGASG